MICTRNKTPLEARNKIHLLLYFFYVFILESLYVMRCTCMRALNLFWCMLLLRFPRSISHHRVYIEMHLNCSLCSTASTPLPHLLHPFFRIDMRNVRRIHVYAAKQQLNYLKKTYYNFLLLLCCAVFASDLRWIHCTYDASTTIYAEQRRSFLT